MLNQTIATLLTVGGIGYINYSVASQLGTIDFHKDAKTQTIAFSACWSIVDFAIFLLCQTLRSHWFTGNWLLVLTMLSTMILAFLLALFTTISLNKLTYFLYNFVLRKNSKATISNGTVWNHIMADDGQECMAYLYNFNHEPLGFGYIEEASNDETSNYSVSLQTFNYDNPEIQDSYNDLMVKIQKPQFSDNYKVREFVDFKQQIIAITIQEN